MEICKIIALAYEILIECDCGNQFVLVSGVRMFCPYCGGKYDVLPCRVDGV